MEKTGKVKKIRNGVAEIEVYRDSACGENCAACGLCGGKQLLVSLAVNDTVLVGDTVRLITDDKKILGLSALGYLSLTALIILGAVLGTALGGEWLGFLISVILLFCGVGMLKKLSPKPEHISVEKI